MTDRVVLVRPWSDAHGGTGCCSGEPRDGVCLEHRVDASTDGDRHADPESLAVAETYRALRRELPDVDVQVVGSSNTAYLLPTVFRTLRRRAGLLAALRAAARSTTAGSVLVNGERVGHVADLGVEGVLAAVRRRART